ncbi:hypothetical protein KFU94_38285 [Chloroflexi bacterium TSY]|nr:hypothetical protein [Chloroflexi bacterium TSY]MBV7333987.1 hypothetical protein [Chloroflexi bacterium TSY]
MFIHHKQNNRATSPHHTPPKHHQQIATPIDTSSALRSALYIQALTSLRVVDGMSLIGDQLYTITNNFQDDMSIDIGKSAFIIV